MGDGEDDWISASEAFTLVRPLYPDDFPTQKALLAGAIAALIDTRARRLISAGKNHDNVDLLPPFWDGVPAPGYGGADWVAGHFISTRYKNSRAERSEAFGVQFNRPQIILHFPALSPPARATGANDSVGRISNEDAELAMSAWAASEAQRLGSVPAHRARVKPPYAAQRSQRGGANFKKVTKDELRQWFPSYAQTSNDYRYESVCSAATSHFHPRPVTRQPLRDIIGEFERTLTRGKPTGI